jgi:N-acetylneuraminic acid mutarotase
LGNNPRSAPRYYHDFWQYDPATDVWTRRADAPTLIEGDFAIAFSLNDSTAYICSGASGGSHPALWLYNVITDQWAQKNNAPFDVDWGPCAMVIGANAYILNGWSENWLYNPSTDDWTQKAFFTSRALGVSFVIGNKGYFGLGSGVQFAHENHYITSDWWEFTP